MRTQRGFVFFFTLVAACNANSRETPKDKPAPATSAPAPLREEQRPPDPPPPPPEPEGVKQLRAAQAAQGGPLNFKQYAPLFPEKLGAFVPESPFEGINEKIAEGVVTATGTRSYRNGEQLAIITIADTFTHPVAPIMKGEAGEALKNELGIVNARDGKIGKHPALLSWNEPAHESQVYMLVGDRLVDVRVHFTNDEKAAEKLAKLLKVDLLLKLRPEPAK
jgi:hypothetical protein